jgi:hypothetical protein
VRVSKDAPLELLGPLGCGIQSSFLGRRHVIDAQAGRGRHAEGADLLKPFAIPEGDGDAVAEGIHGYRSRSGWQTR